MSASRRLTSGRSRLRAGIIYRGVGRPAKPKKVKEPHPLPPEAEIQAALAAAARRVETQRPAPLPATSRQPKPKRIPPAGDQRFTSPTGQCHLCGRPVTGDRKLCGPCLAKRTR